MIPLGDRSEWWTADLVTRDGQHSALPLDADQPGTLTWDKSRQSPITATIYIHGNAPDLLADPRVRLTLWVNGEPHQMPPLVPAKDDPVIEHGSWYQLQLVDETIIYAMDGLDFPQAWEPGSPAIGSARALLASSAPDLRVVLPDSSHTLRNPVTAQLGTDPLTLANGLLEAINATPLAPRLTDGALASQPWTPPTERPVVMTFGPDDAGYEHRVDLTHLHLEAPNVQHFEANGSASAPKLVGRWRDLDPTSPYSIPRRHRRILGQRRSGEAATQQVADALARRYGLEARGRGRQATITGLWQPVTPGDVIETRHPLEPALNARWEVLVMRTIIGEVSDTTWTLKEVA